MAGLGLLERDTELAELERLLDAAASGRGRVLVLVGEAGIGKTALVAACVAAAAARGFRVCSAAGGVLETGFPFGVARRLLGAPASLTGAAAAAGPALGLRSVGGRSLDAGQRAVSFELQHGLYWLVADLAERAPLLVAVDDVQWADPDSLGFLLYLARRLDELPLALLLAVREGEPCAAEATLALLRLGAQELAPAPLSEAAARELVAAAGLARPPAAATRTAAAEPARSPAAAARPAARAQSPTAGGAAGEPARLPAAAARAAELAAACHEASGGNPFLLRALLEDLPADVAAVRAAGPVAVRRSVLLRLARLGPAAVALAQAVAILERDASLAVAGALVDIDPPAARAAADALIAARVLDAAHPLRFVHPVLRAAVYADVGLARRAAGHRRAAELLDAVDPDRAALHLLATHPAADPWVLERLRAAADRALAQGSTSGARALLERAVEEAPGGTARAEVLLALAEAERRGDAPPATADRAAPHHAGPHGAPPTPPVAGPLGLPPPERAAARLEEALSLAEDTELRVRIVRELAGLRWARGELGEARALLEATLASLPAGPARLELDADRAAYAGLLARGDAPDVTGLRGDTPAERRLLATAAFQRMIWSQTTGAEVGRLAERALAGGRLIADVGIGHPSVLAVLSTLLVVERDADVEALIGRARAGAATEVTVLRALAARLALFRGDLRGAEAIAREAIMIADAAGLEHVRRYLMPVLVQILVERGELDAAEAELTTPLDSTRWMLLQSRAALRRAQGRHAEALEDVRRADEERSGAAGASVLGRAMLALSLHAVGEPAEAVAAEAVEHARRWAVPSTLGMALRVQGLVTNDVEPLRSAADTLDGTPRARSSTSARRCAAPTPVPKHASRSPPAWSSRIAAARCRSQPARARSSWPAAPGRGGSCGPGSTRSHRASCGSPSSPPPVSPIARSRSRCSSRARPSRPTSRASTASWASMTASGSPQNSRVPHPRRSRRRRARLSRHDRSAPPRP